MVGIPQQDKGCQRCRRMKKGCNRERPTCSYCRRLGATCVYAEKQWTFVTSGHESTSSRSSSDEPRELILHDSLAITAKSIAVVDEFWSIYLPKDAPTIRYLDQKPSVPWMRTIQEHSMDEALRACAFVVVGEAKGDRHYIAYSQRLYGTGLRKVNRSLQNPEKMDITTSLATIKALSMYERLRKEEQGTPMTQAANWQRHVQGICHLLAFRGARLHDVQGGDDLAENVHLNAIIVNFMMRKPQLNVSAHHMTAPEPPLRSQLLRLMDAVPDSLSMYDQVKSLIRQSRQQPSLRTLAMQEGQMLLTKLANLLQLFKGWEDAMTAELNADYILQGMPPVSLLDCCTDFGFGIFYAITLYWSTNVVVLATAEASRKIMDDFAGYTTEDYCQLSTTYDSRYYACAVARHAGQFFSVRAGEWGGEAATFPFGVANRYFWATGLENSPEMEMLYAASRTNIHTVQFLRSIAANSPRLAMSEIEAAAHRKSAKQWYGLTLD